MASIKFYEARKKEAGIAYKEAMLCAKVSKESQENVEQMARSAARFVTKFDRDGKTEEDVFAHWFTAIQWYKDAMPFYRVYPAFQKQLLALGEDFLDNLNAFDFDIDQSLKAIAIEFPISNEPTHVCELVTALKKGSEHTKSQLDFYMYSNFWYKEYGVDKHTSYILRFYAQSIKPNSFREQCSKTEKTSDREMFSNALRTYAAIIAIGDNPDLLQPIPLSNDRDKYEETRDPKYIDKAKRRGVFGFEVGKVFQDEEQIEENIKRSGGSVAPHYRKSHLAWQPHGPGNSLRKLILKKGSHVNFEKAKKVPTGYYGQEGIVAK
jgi:hypothetical protein